MWIDRLGVAVRQCLGRDLTVREGWRMLPMGSSMGSATGGVYRLEGEATAGRQGAPVPWALVLKMLCPDATDPAAFDYWEREALVYRSGLLAGLPSGISAPRCHGIDARPDGTLWLWLEPVMELDWTLECYGQVARDLGRFNGAYLAGQALPDPQPWLSRNWMRGFRTRWAGSRNQALVRSTAAWAKPRLQSLAPGPMQERVLRMWDRSEDLCAVLDRLPRTFCHRDAHRTNLFCRPSADRAETVAIDWAYAGDGAVGEEIVPLIISSLWYGQVEPHRAAELDGAVWAGYLGGLRDAGWQGDERLARLGYAAGAVARWDTLPGQMVGLAQDSACDLEVLASRLATSRALLDLADEATDLAAALCP